VIEAAVLSLRSSGYAAQLRCNISVDTECVTAPPI
jgi:hypothetical protein